MSAAGAIRVAAATGVLWGTARVARSGIPAWDRSAFRAVNAMPDAIAPVAWLPMQAGALASPIAVGVVLGVRGDARRAARIGATGVAAWGVAKAVKRAVGRGRPGDTIEDTVLRLGSADVGLGFPSGHAAVAAGIAAAWNAESPLAATGLAALSATVGLARIYVGAHYPLDVVGGWALGVALGDAIRVAEAAVTPRLGA